jgi:hypothetical protein
VPNLPNIGFNPHYALDEGQLLETYLIVIGDA